MIFSVALCVLKQSVCLVEVFLVRTSTVSRDASLLEFRVNRAFSHFCVVSNTPN